MTQPIAPDAASRPCRLCGGPSALVGAREGRWRRRPYRWYRCSTCAFVFVGDPDLDFERIYDDAYYAGQGADDRVDYLFELEHPDQAVRQLEWQGVVDVVRSMFPLERTTRWLDYGCGNGGLVRHLRRTIGCEAVGFEEGTIARRAADHGIPIVARSALGALAGTFDVVTAIEVFEHVLDPLATLREIFSLLKEPGLFFFTTGNTRPVRDVLRWSYAVPEVHISLYEPGCMERALRACGFSVAYPGFTAGHAGVFAFKMLKAAGVRRMRAGLRWLPWTALARLADRKYQLTRFPVGWKGAPPW